LIALFILLQAFISLRILPAKEEIAETPKGLFN
jgi:hypothetical protein